MILVVVGLVLIHSLLNVNSIVYQCIKYGRSALGDAVSASGAYILATVLTQTLYSECDSAHKVNIYPSVGNLLDALVMIIALMTVKAKRGCKINDCVFRLLQPYIRNQTITYGDNMRQVCIRDVKDNGE